MAQEGPRRMRSSTNDGSPGHEQSRSEAPMSDYNSNALTALRGELKIKVVMKPHLIDMLEIAAGGFMTTAEALSVRNAESPMEQLIAILLGKGDEEFEIFCDMLRKSNHRGWAVKLKQEAVSLRTGDRKEDCKAVVTFVRPQYDVERSDRRWLRKAIKEAAKNRKPEPDKLMKTLYLHTYTCVAKIIEKDGTEYIRDIVRTAQTYIELGLTEGDAEALTTTLTVTDVLCRLGIPKTWDNTDLLEEIVNCLPEEARTLAMSLVDRYILYLDVYDDILRVQDSLTKDVAKATKEQISGEVTVSKDLSEFTRRDCKDMLHLLLHISWKIPCNKCIATEARSVSSTTIVFLIDKAFMGNIIQGSVEASSLWAFQELGVTKVVIGVFELNVVQMLAQHFKKALRSGLTGSMDFVSATKTLPYQVYALVDPDMTERLRMRTISQKIVRPWAEQEESVYSTAYYEVVQTSPEMDESSIPPKLEKETESEDVGKMKIVTGNGEQLSRVQELEDELKDSEQKNMDLSQHNISLQNKLKTSQKKEGRVHRENATLKERLVTMLTSQNEEKIRLKNSERKRMDLFQRNNALQKLLKTCQEQKRHIQQENAQLEELLPELSSQTTSDPVAEAMQEAASEGNRSHLQLLVKQFINVADKGGRTPLLLAAEGGHTDLVRLLTERYEGDIFRKMKNSRNALHLAAYRGHLPVLQYLCPMFGDRLTDRDANDESCLDIARRLGRSPIVEFLTQNCPQFQDKVGADVDTVRLTPSDGPSARTPSRRWWLKISAESSDTSLIPSSPKRHAERSGKIEGEVVFRRDSRSNLMKAVSGTEWMYQREALKRGRQAPVTALRWQEFTRYHQRWLADYVQEDKEESCKQWLLHSIQAQKHLWPSMDPELKPTSDSTNSILPPMPVDLQVISSILHENKVYVTGIATDYKRRRVLVYSLDEGKWSMLKVAPNYNAPTAVLNSHITLIGGRENDAIVTNVLYSWIEEENEWKRISPPIPRGRLSSGVCHYDGLLLVIGGVEDTSYLEPVNTVVVFSKDHWVSPEMLQLPKALRSPQVVIFKEYVYIMGGATTFPARMEEGEAPFNHQAWRVSWSDVKEAVRQAEIAVKQGVQTMPGEEEPRPTMDLKSIWRRIADPPAVRPTAASCKDSLLLVGGAKGGIPQKGIYEFIDGENADGKDDGCGSWRLVGNMSVGRYRHAVVPVHEDHGTALFVAGGCVQDNPEGKEKHEDSSSTELVIL